MLIRLAIALLMAFAIYRFGLYFLKTIGNTPPPPPPSGELRRIKMNYRCAVCGTEVRITRAATESPEPPRHCMDEMEFVPGFED